ncbi:DUF2797 domain-containing protein [Carnimonas bestiolae]|uniref:DUF2797 domain-containing protein n=1 Tax=Carnimonas bestiolae TaxID=3402172 RepID=UPI003EDCAAD8
MGEGVTLQGHARKLDISAADNHSVAQYRLPLGEHSVDLNGLLGQRIRLRQLGEIRCVACGKRTKKSFSQGHCWYCFTHLARCDRCIMAPELCHYFEGTCREPEWGERHCFAPHIVYLAASASLKVGITKPSQMPVRWLDQGASQALPIFSVASRQQSGMVEDLLRSAVSDRTPWQRMLKGEQLEVDLAATAVQLRERFRDGLQALSERFGEGAITPYPDSQAWHFHYPVLEAPSKVKSIDLERTPELEGTLLGLKGQYLILDSGVINVRRFQGYLLEFDAA